MTSMKVKSGKREESSDVSTEYKVDSHFRFKVIYKPLGSEGISALVIFNLKP